MKLILQICDYFKCLIIICDLIENNIELIVLEIISCKKNYIKIILLFLLIDHHHYKLF